MQMKYIFAGEGLEGIKFYDRSPSKVEQKLIGELPDGVFHTDKNSISSATWNDDINKPNTTIMVNYREGSGKVTTYIVSEAKYQEILNAIINANKENSDKIVIDTREKETDIKSQAKKEIITITAKDIANLDKERKINLHDMDDANRELYNSEKSKYEGLNKQ